MTTGIVAVLIISLMHRTISIDDQHGRALISNQDLREFAEFLVRWYERNIEAGLVKTHRQ